MFHSFQQWKCSTCGAGATHVELLHRFRDGSYTGSLQGGVAQGSPLPWWSHHQDLGASGGMFEISRSTASSPCPRSALLRRSCPRHGKGDSALCSSAPVLSCDTDGPCVPRSEAGFPTRRDFRRTDCRGGEERRDCRRAGHGGGSPVEDAATDTRRDCRGYGGFHVGFPTLLVRDKDRKEGHDKDQASNTPAYTDITNIADAYEEEYTARRQDELVEAVLRGASPANSSYVRKLRYGGQRGLAPLKIDATFFHLKPPRVPDQPFPLRFAYCV